MKRMLNPESALHYMAAKIDDIHWQHNQQAMIGSVGKHRLKLQAFASGLTIAIAIERTANQLAQACLLLASVQIAGDDAFYCADGQGWLLRRYPVALKEVELDLLFKQQLSIASLLTPSEEDPPSTSIIGLPV